MSPDPSQQKKKKDRIHPGWLPVYHNVVPVYCYTLIIADTRCLKGGKTQKKKKNIFPVNATSAVWFYLPLEAALQFNWPVFSESRSNNWFYRRAFGADSRCEAGPLSSPHPYQARALLMHRASRE